METDSTSLLNFIEHYVNHAPQMMWLLGAGTSRSAGLPTATDIIWDLKRRYYCLHENQNLQFHDINIGSIKYKIQSYMDSQGFPAMWSPEEYSFYFELTFKDDYAAQQAYIQKMLDSEKVSLNIGHRAFAALLAMNQMRVVFTTNFDNVIETAYANVAGKELPTFHLEGSHATLAALNSDRFPLYAKLHGDFRYQSIKNLSDDLRENDAEIQQCFLAAAVRFGLVVSGYSGRDENVMSMLQKAVDQNNAFPHGLFWTVPKLTSIERRAKQLVNYAQDKGVNAKLVETGTFDEMLSKIWRQVDYKPLALDQKVRTATVTKVNIKLPEPGQRYPILRTNALPILEAPKICGAATLNTKVTFDDLQKRAHDERLFLDWILYDKDIIYFFGAKSELGRLVSPQSQPTITSFEFQNVVEAISNSTFIKSFLERALARSLCQGKPLFLRRKGKTHFAVVRHDSARDSNFMDLRKALGYKGSEVAIAGSVQGLKDVTWAECVSMKLEERNGRLWLMLEPSIWIKPLARREEASDFKDKRLLKRWNSQANQVLNAWIGILLGATNIDGARISCFGDTEFPAVFEIGTQTAFSARV